MDPLRKRTEDKSKSKEASTILYPVRLFGDVHGGIRKREKFHLFVKH